MSNLANRLKEFVGDRAEKTVDDIAHDYGYSDRSCFSEHFKKIVGQPLGQYKRQVRRKQRIDNIVQVIAANVLAGGELCTIQELAKIERYGNLNKFREDFKHETGQCPSRYIGEMQRRFLEDKKQEMLERAVDLLRTHSHLRCDEIARECGFKTVTDLEKAYRRTTGRDLFKPSASPSYSPA